MVLYFKSCLRCKDGTVELGSDSFGVFLNCLTCGYTINSRSIRSNGSIEEPTVLEDDKALVPLPVGMADDLAIDQRNSGIDATGDDFGTDSELDFFEDDLEDLVVEEEAAAI